MEMMDRGRGQRPRWAYYRSDPEHSFPSAVWMDGTPVVSVFVEDVEVVSDLTPAEWIAPRLLTWGVGEGTRAGSVVPVGFEAYARVFHPAQLRARDQTAPPESIAWSEVARATGRVAHPRMQWETITYPADGRTVPHFHEPMTGLTQEVASVLVEALRPYTDTPEQCWMAVWEGWGDLPEVDAPLIEHPSRRYVLLRGDSDAVVHPLWRDSRRGNLGYTGPSIWWPDDRAWCVASEIDFSWTYVGGSRDCVNRLLQDERVEAFEVQSSDRGDLLSDEINPLPPQLRKRHGPGE